MANKTKFTVDLYRQLTAEGVEFSVQTEKGQQIDGDIFINDKKNTARAFLGGVLREWDADGKINGYIGLDLYILMEAT
jgi:hypothetical protein